MHGKASESTQIADERLARFDRGLEEEQIHGEHVTVFAPASPKKTDRVLLEGHRRPEQGETLFDVRR